MPKSRILVIDDEAAIRDSLKMTLEYDGYEFIGAATGQEGLALAEREAPDLVLLDVKMPGMDGIEVLEPPAAMNETLPVVVISGHGTISTAVEATKKGAFDFHREAVRERSRARQPWQRARSAPAARREPVAQEGGRSPAPDGRRQRGPQAGDGGGQPRGADQRDRAHPGRERRRQGARRADHSPQQPAEPRAVRAGELRRHSRRADRVGALRPREGIVHRRDREAGRQVRAGRPRDDLPRRSRRHEREDAGQGAARAAGGRSRAARIGADHQGGRPRDRRDQQEPRGGDREGTIPRGSVLPARRDSDPRAAAARAARGHPAARAALHRAVQPREQHAAEADHAGRARRAPARTGGRATSASCATPSNG